ncbi:type II toxin-antitoxin system HicB family antitoxin [Rubrobacter calidifluminis]|uniref:type II toxin-antitoxin system HicB family antitoxin n=1 Tax=Rubrobacter calidifluminis TaxID=1392640 RepID=UPI00235F6983|nr:type II toxin-antitoxin system HicB family antitoxin [Rubrobacter calidifluminis]
MHGTFTAIFERGEDGWWVATCPEVPGAITQGKTIEEARENLKDAIELVLEVMREDAERELEGKEGVIRETLEVRSAARSSSTSPSTAASWEEKERKALHLPEPRTGKRTSVPRHTEIDNLTARKICEQLGIPAP